MNEQQEQKNGKTLGRFFRWGALILAVVLVWQVLKPAIVNWGRSLSAEPTAQITAQEYYDLAANAIEEENYASAQLLLEKARQALPAQLTSEERNLLAQVWLASASIYILTGDWTSAEEALNSTLEANPEETQALLLLGQLLIEQGDYPAAIEKVLAYLELVPEDGDTRRTLAQLMEAQEDYVAASGQYEILYAQNPQDEACRLNALRCLFLCGRYSQAIEGFDAYISELGEGEDPYGGIAEFLRAACRMELGEYAVAAEGFAAASGFGYDRAACLEQIILCRFQQGDYAAVLAAGESLSGLDTTMVTSLKDTWQRVGISAVCLEDYETGLDALDLAAEMDSELEGNAYYRGICLLSMNRPEEAVEAFTLSIDLGFLPQFCYYNRGVCYVNLLEYEKALEDMERALETGDDEELTQAATALQTELMEYLDLSA